MAASDFGAGRAGQGFARQLSLQCSESLQIDAPLGAFACILGKINQALAAMWPDNRLVTGYSEGKLSRQHRI